MVVQADGMLATLATRFEQNPGRHVGIEWAEVVVRLELSPEKLAVLTEMERTGGEPDVVGRCGRTGEILFVDCAKETPAGRRSLCYDAEALAARKEHKPAGSAVELAAAIGIELLDERSYRKLQEVGTFDTKTSSWIETPEDVRALGGALFCDRRYGRVFVYHNGAQSYYGARGFRGMLRV
jgi:hypothetical protein